MRSQQKQGSSLLHLDAPAMLPPLLRYIAVTTLLLQDIHQPAAKAFGPNTSRHTAAYNAAFDAAFALVDPLLRRSSLTAAA
jgi:hypothetical protein